MRVRPAVCSESAAITSAYIASWRGGYQDLLTKEELDTQAEKRITRDWASAIGKADRIVLVAESDSGGILGVAECEHAPVQGRQPWLQMLYVIPSAWGTGVAGDLLHEALNAASEVGNRTVWLEELWNVRRGLGVSMNERASYSTTRWNRDPTDYAIYSATGTISLPHNAGTRTMPIRLVRLSSKNCLV